MKNQKRQAAPFGEGVAFLLGREEMGFSSRMSSMAQVAEEARFAPVILAGGSGTRFWPRSRRARAKQVLALDGETTMIQQTLERLLPLGAVENVWVVTNELLVDTICEQLPDVPDGHILSEPAAR